MLITDLRNAFKESFNYFSAVIETRRIDDGDDVYSDLIDFLANPENSACNICDFIGELADTYGSSPDSGLLTWFNENQNGAIRLLNEVMGDEYPDNYDFMEHLESAKRLEVYQHAEWLVWQHPAVLAVATIHYLIKECGSTITLDFNSLEEYLRVVRTLHFTSTKVRDFQSQARKVYSLWSK